MGLKDPGAKKPAQVTKKGKKYSCFDKMVFCFVKLTSLIREEKQRGMAWHLTGFRKQWLFEWDLLDCSQIIYLSWVNLSALNEWVTIIIIDQSFFFSIVPKVGKNTN